MAVQLVYAGGEAAVTAGGTAMLALSQMEAALTDATAGIQAETGGTVSDVCTVCWPCSLLCWFQIPLGLLCTRCQVQVSSVLAVTHLLQGVTLWLLSASAAVAASWLQLFVVCRCRLVWRRSVATRCARGASLQAARLTVQRSRAAPLAQHLQRAGRCSSAAVTARATQCWVLVDAMTVCLDLTFRCCTTAMLV